MEGSGRAPGASPGFFEKQPCAARTVGGTSAGRRRAARTEAGDRDARRLTGRFGASQQRRAPVQRAAHFGHGHAAASQFVEQALHAKLQLMGQLA